MPSNRVHNRYTWQQFQNLGYYGKMEYCLRDLVDAVINEHRGSLMSAHLKTAIDVAETVLDRIDKAYQKPSPPTWELRVLEAERA